MYFGQFKLFLVILMLKIVVKLNTFRTNDNCFHFTMAPLCSQQPIFQCPCKAEPGLLGTQSLSVRVVFMFLYCYVNNIWKCHFLSVYLLEGSCLSLYPLFLFCLITGQLLWLVVKKHKIFLFGSHLNAFMYTEHYMCFCYTWIWIFLWLFK